MKGNTVAKSGKLFCHGKVLNKYFRRVSKCAKILEVSLEANRSKIKEIEGS